VDVATSENAETSQKPCLNAHQNDLIGTRPADFVKEFFTDYTDPIFGSKIPFDSDWVCGYDLPFLRADLKRKFSRNVKFMSEGIVQDPKESSHTFTETELDRILERQPVEGWKSNMQQDFNNFYGQEFWSRLDHCDAESWKTKIDELWKTVDRKTTWSGVYRVVLRQLQEAEEFLFPKSEHSGLYKLPQVSGQKDEVNQEMVQLRDKTRILVNKFTLGRGGYKGFPVHPERGSKYGVSGPQTEDFERLGEQFKYLVEEAVVIFKALEERVAHDQSPPVAGSFAGTNGLQSITNSPPEAQASAATSLSVSDSTLTSQQDVAKENHDSVSSVDLSGGSYDVGASPSSPGDSGAQHQTPVQGVEGSGMGTDFSSGAQASTAGFSTEKPNVTENEQNLTESEEKTLSGNVSLPLVAESSPHALQKSGEGGEVPQGITPSEAASSTNIIAEASEGLRAGQL
jgi:hypothetical protein